MANASADKFKGLALRHGEKVVMGLTAALCVMFLGMAVSKPSIETTPENVKKAAEQAETNLRTPQKPEDILHKLEEGGLKNPDFVKMVDAQEKDKLNPLAYRVPSPWVTFEPGAGLIRDMPELIAPAELLAYPGRGSALVFALDDNGERVPEPKKEVVETPQTRRRKKKKKRAAGSMGSMAMMQQSMGSAGGAPKTDAKAKAAAEKKYQEEVKRKNALVAGKVDTSKQEPEKPAEAEGPFKEVTKGLRWVAITGTLDNKKLRENYLQALKQPEIAYPHFKQLDVERQVLGSDGEWSEWEPVDLEQNWAIVNNLPEEEEELTPDTARIDALVDPLPFLRAGYWEKVHVAKLVPKEKLEVEKPVVAAASGGMGGSAEMQMQMQMQQQQMQVQQQQGMQQEQMMQQQMQMMQQMGSGGAGFGGGAETINFEHEDSDSVMVRSLDFTVEPDKTYRFRLRIVVFNPNKGREDISPGVDNKSAELNGPWSEPTNEVTMPPDVATYALHPTPRPNSGKRLEPVQFQVAKWNPDDGITVLKTFDAAPGEIIGDTGSVYVPGIDGGEKKSRRIDFNSQRVVLDTIGGTQRIPSALGIPGIIEVPAVSLLLRSDGSVVLHTQEDDVPNEVRKDMEGSYKRELEESGKERESSLGMGSMMGMPGAAR